MTERDTCLLREIDSDSSSLTDNVRVSEVDSEKELDTVGDPRVELTETVAIMLLLSESDGVSVIEFDNDVSDEALNVVDAVIDSVGLADAVALLVAAEAVTEGVAELVMERDREFSELAETDLVGRVTVADAENVSDREVEKVSSEPVGSGDGDTDSDSDGVNESLPPECSCESDCDGVLLGDGRVTVSVCENEAVSESKLSVKASVGVGDGVCDADTDCDVVVSSDKDRLGDVQHLFAADLVHETLLAELARLPKLLFVMIVWVSNRLHANRIVTGERGEATMGSA